MTDIQFYNSFKFNIYHFNRYRMTDNSGGSDCHFLARMLKGNARIAADDRTIYLKSGDVFYIPKNLRYKSYWHPDENGELSFSSFGFEYMPTNVSYSLQKVNVPDISLIEKLENKPCVTMDSVALLYTVLSQIIDNLDVSGVFSGSLVVQKSLEYLTANPSMSVPELAKLCGVSESGLYKLFKKHLNMTPVDMRHKILTDKATDLLVSTDLSIEEISAALGFSSSSYFRKVLFAQCGKSPSEIRKDARSV